MRKIKDKKIAESIFDAVDHLQYWPNCQNVKALPGHKYNYRLCIGPWRIFFDIKKHLGIIEVEEVKKRDEHTY